MLDLELLEEGDILHSAKGETTRNGTRPRLCPVGEKLVGHDLGGETADIAENGNRTTICN